MLNILDFGAVGDGKTDCTKQIQAALDAAAPKREAVMIPEGVFLTSTLRIPDFTGLVGTTLWGYRDTGGSILKLNDENAECMIDLSNTRGATLNGLSLTGERIGKGIHGVMVNRPDYRGHGEEDTFKIERCRIEAFSGHGLYLNRVWCFSVRHNMISHNGGDGIYLRGWDSFILDNWLTGNEGAGLGARDESAACTFTGNRVEWNYEAGIEISGGDHYTIVANFFDRQGGPGIDLKSNSKRTTNHITINANILYRNGKPERCDGKDYSSSQVRMIDAKGIVFTSNIIQAYKDDPNSGPSANYSPQYGIVIGQMEDSIIKDNVLREGFLKEGLVDLGKNENVIIKDNIFSKYEIG